MMIWSYYTPPNLCTISKSQRTFATKNLNASHLKQENKNISLANYIKEDHTAFGR